MREATMRQRGASVDDLMRAVSAGQAAFSELLDRHRGWVLRLLYSMTHDRECAEDLVQEVFTRVHQHASDYTPQANFTAWVRRIALNLAKNLLRQQRRTVLVPL